MKEYLTIKIKFDIGSAASIIIVEYEFILKYEKNILMTYHIFNTVLYLANKGYGRVTIQNWPQISMMAFYRSKKSNIPNLIYS